MATRTRPLPQLSVIDPSLDGRPDPRLAEVSAVFCAALGPGYLSVKDLQVVVARPRQRLVVATVADVVVGAAVATLITPAAAQDLLAGAGASGRLGTLTPGPVGLLQSSAVLDAFRRRGIGAQLIDARIEWFTAARATAAVALSWKPSSRRSAAKGTSEGPLRRAGLAELGVISRYWAGDPAVSCPACRRGCVCDALLFGRRLA